MWNGGVLKGDVILAITYEFSLFPFTIEWDFKGD